LKGRIKLGEGLIEEDAWGNMFRIAKQMVKKSRYVAGAGCVKDADGEIVKRSA